VVTILSMCDVSLYPVAAFSSLRKFDKYNSGNLSRKLVDRFPACILLPE